MRFREADAEHLFTGRHRGEPVLADRFRGELGENIADQAAIEHAVADIEIAPCDLLDCKARSDAIGILTAIGLGRSQPEQAERPHFYPLLVRKRVVAIPKRIFGEQDFTCEIPDRLLHHPLFITERKIHVELPASGVARANKPDDIASLAQFDHRAVAILLEHPAATQWQVPGRGLVEDPDAGRPEMRQRGIEVLDLQGHDDIAMREIALPRELHQFDDRALAGVEECAANLQFRDVADDRHAKQGHIPIEGNALVEILDDDRDVIEPVYHREPSRMMFVH